MLHIYVTVVGVIGWIWQKSGLSVHRQFSGCLYICISQS